MDRFKRRSLGQIICDDMKEYAALVGFVEWHKRHYNQISCRGYYSKDARDHGIDPTSAAMFIAGYIEHLQTQVNKE